MPQRFCSIKGFLKDAKSSKKVQKPALGLVSREHYAKGKKLVQDALVQLAGED